MAQPPDRRGRMTDPRKAAEAMFKPKVAPPPPPPRPGAVPGAKEQVSLRIDRDILDFFQDDGPGWQDRMVAVLRSAMDAAKAKSIPLKDLNASNDE